jgi:hypothetical protein
MSFSQVGTSTTPGRTYSIEVGAGAVRGPTSNGTITCRRGVVGATETSTVSFGGTSKLSAFIAEGGGCAKNTGGVERGSDGGISANGRTGGRGGSSAYRTTTGSGNSREVILDTTTAYTTTGEVSATGYTAGGLALTIAQAPTIGNQTGAATSYISFDNAVWTSALTARGALIYKAGDNGAVCVLDFGSDKTSNTTFTVQFPAVTNTSAIIRIS